MKKETHTAIIKGEPQRLQEYGVGIFSILETKSSLKKALKKNLIKVNGMLATTGTLIFGGETIEDFLATLEPEAAHFNAIRDAAEKEKKLVFSVPSGNYGNICAGMMA